MLKYLSIIIILFFACSSNQQQTDTEDLKETKIYLVRHAEKANDGTNDPPLNEAGIQRSETLADLLITEDISKIYSTDYKRTRNTAAPLGKIKQLKTEEYDPSDPEFYKKIKEEAKSSNILIVGHSNTIPMLVNQLIGREKYPQLEEMEYDKLFIITQKGGKFQSEIQIF